MVYRGSVSFILAARAEGELLDNNQVVLMMRLSLCMVWFSIFQHFLLFYPNSRFMTFDTLTPTTSIAIISESNNITLTKNEKDLSPSPPSVSFQSMREWIFYKLVRNPYVELENDDINDNGQDTSELTHNNS